jgi:drug/metabolite transporter (DMT)-like permease
MDAGASVLITTFWTLLGRESLALVFPLLVPKLRSDVVSFPFAKNRAFLLANTGVIALFFIAIFLNTFAIAHGPMALVPVVWNLQPFVTLMLGWCVMRTLPKLVFTEDFSTTSMLIKVVSYSLTFLGLASIALHG